MRDKFVLACMFLGAFAAMGCSLDEVFNLDVSKNACKGVRSLELYEFDKNGDVVSRGYCSAGEACTKDKDYRGALAYGICPNDLPICREGIGGRFCSVCRENYIVCGKDANNQVKCVNPKTDSEYCGAKGLCNSGDLESPHFRGVACREHYACVDGACVLEDGYCDPLVKYPVCDGNTILRCNEKTGKKLSEDCEKRGLVCDKGECKAPKCSDAGIQDGTCSEDGRSYYTCDEEGRVHRETCNEGLTCRPGIGCKVECSESACYAEADKAGILRVCKDGQFVDEKCPEFMACNGGRCKCVVGDQQCHVRKAGEEGRGKNHDLNVKEGELGVRECVYESDTDQYAWKYVEVCDSDQPLCDRDVFGYHAGDPGTEHYLCTDGRHGIGSPCQIIVKDDKGNDHVCSSGDVEDTLCTYTINGMEAAEFIDPSVQEYLSYLPIMSPMIWENALSSMRSIDHFVDYTNNVFPKDASVIRGCENVIVPEGMQLGCMTSQTMIVMKKYSTFKAFLDLAFQDSDSRVWMNKFLGMLEDTDEHHGVQFTAPNGYCFVGTYDLTMSGWYFNLFFANKKEDGTLYAAMLHSNAEKRVHGVVDIANTVPKHPEGAAVVKAGKCPEGSVGFSYSDPLYYLTGMRYINGRDNPMVDVVDFAGRIGYDVCLKSCKDEANSTDCRAGYKCMRLPTVSACAYESIDDVVARGDYQTACFSEALYTMISNLRNRAMWGANGEERPEKDSDYCRDGLCCGSLERDWGTENVSCDRILKDGDVACLSK